MTTRELTLPEQELLLALQEADERDDAEEHPANLLDRVKCIDATSGETFEFQLVDPEAPWYWQREVLDGWIKNSKSVILKARQLGITWLAAGLALWTVLYRPGTRVLVISINEEEASKVVNRIWDMMQSLPEHLRNDVEVIKPTRGHRPALNIELRHKDGRISSVIGLPSTKKAGHGETAALVVLDEYARHEYAQDSWKALVPTTSNGGKLIAISTGNGISTTNARGDTAGNFFHSLWVSNEDSGLYKRFLRWDMHPDRDQDWYSRIAMAIPNPSDRAEQFPANEHDAFILTGSPFFDPEAIMWYIENAALEPARRYTFQKVTHDKAKIVEESHGSIREYKPPAENHDYCLAADVATGRGADYSCAYVVDLGNMEVCAQFHGKLDADQYAYQLHYLGRRYNTAWLAIEMGGGYGEPVVLSLRDGREGRPAYPRLYRHRQLDRGDQPEAKPYGFPMNMKTRPTVIENVSEVLREKLVPRIDHELIRELQTFVVRNRNPSPAAQDGCNDDRVMAFAIALELYRQRGFKPGKEKRRQEQRSQSRQPRKTAYPWQTA